MAAIDLFVVGIAIITSWIAIKSGSVYFRFGQVRGPQMNVIKASRRAAATNSRLDEANEHV